MTTERSNELTSLVIERGVVQEVESEGESIDTRRMATLLKLEWLAERSRKVARIKNELAAGKYCVGSREIARSMLNLK